MKPHILVTSIAALLVSTALYAQTWDGGGANNNWSTDNNWNTNIEPVNNGTANIIMSGSMQTTSNVDVPWSINFLRFDNAASAFTLTGSQLTIGAGGIRNEDIQTQTINNAIVLAAPQTWSAFAGGLDFGGAANISTNGNSLTLAGSAALISVNGAISGGGAVTISGSQGATFDGAASNTYTGLTTVGGTGSLTLGKNAGATAIAGNLTIGEDDGGTVKVRLEASNQIANTSTVTVLSDGVFDMDDFGAVSETISVLKTVGGTAQIGLSSLLVSSQIEMTAGTISSTSAGGVILGGDLRTLAAANAATISGVLDLNGGTRTFTIMDGAAVNDLDITGVVQFGGIIKADPGTLRLAGANSFVGGVNLGSNLLTVQVDSGSATLGGVISGTGALTKSGTNTALIAGASANTYNGLTTVNAGTLVLGKNVGVNAFAGPLVIGDGAGTDTAASSANHQIPDTSAVTINSSGRLDFATFAALDTVGPVTINGGLADLGAGSLTVNGLLQMTAGSVTATGSGGLVLFGNVTGNASAVSATIDSPLSLGGGTRTFAIADGTVAQDMIVSGAISAGSLIKTGAGTLSLTGSTANTFSATTVNEGVLELGKSLPNSTVNGELLTIGDGLGGANVDVVRLLANQQIGGESIGAPQLTINSSGLLDLNDFDETVGDIFMSGGNITSGAGVLTVPFDATISADSNSTATISGKLRLAGDSHVFSVGDGAMPIDLDIPAVISGTSATSTFSKTGAGTLRLSGANEMYGLSLFEGTLAIGNNDALGQNYVTLNGGTVQADGAPRTLSYGMLINTDITFAGGFVNTLTFNAGVQITGTRTLAISGTSLTLNGPIVEVLGTGFGITQTFGPAGNGNLTLGGSESNTYTGLTTLISGALFLAKTGGAIAVPGNLFVGDSIGTDTVSLVGSDQIADTSRVFMFSAGRLQMNVFDDTIAELNFRGGQVLGTAGVATLTINGNVNSLANPTMARIEVDVDLGGATRTFTVADGPPAIDLVATNDITNGSLIKAGDGTLALNGALGTGASTLSADAGATFFGTDQTLSALNIAAGAIVILEENLVPSPTLAVAVSAVPEPGIGAFFANALVLLGLRRSRSTERRFHF